MDEPLLSIERDLYEGVLDDAAWARALLGIAGLAGAPYVCAMTRNDRTGQFEFLETVETSEATMRAFNETFSVMSPLNTLPILQRPGDQFLDLNYLGNTLERLPFYQEFLRPIADISYLMGHKIGVFDGVHCNLSIHRAVGDQPFDEADAARVARLHTAMERCFKLRFRLKALDQQRLWSRAALDRLAHPVLIADAGGQILQANQPGDRWLQSRACMLGRAGQSRFMLPKILRILRQACGTDGPARSATLRVDELNGRAPVLLLAVPLPEAQAGLWREPVAMLLALGNARTQTPGELLREVFGLTGVEVRLLQRLAQLDSVNEAADILGISLSTARTYLKSILHKMGTRRQQELVRLTTELGLVSWDEGRRGV